jgi:hypothetical protein
MANNVCDDTAYLNSIDQKTRFQLLNIPPIRYNNLNSNPYEQINPATGRPFTKNDVDMRRKAEILKYSSNRMSTQTNNLTNSQKYAQLARGLYQRRTYSKEFIQQNTDANGLLQICPPGTIIKTPSSASDIPGPPIDLYEDDNVPLYNFNSHIDSAYGIQNQSANPYTKDWDFTNRTNTQCPFINGTTTYATFTNIYIMNTNSPSYTYNIITPFSMSINGSLQTAMFGNAYSDSTALRININSVSVNVKYSYWNVTLNPNPAVTYDHGLDANLNPINPIDISINIPVGQTTFNANVYLGTLNISALNLLTVKGYIYDIQAAINYQITYPSGQYSNSCNFPTISSFINIPLNSVFPIQQLRCSTTGGSQIVPSNFPVLSVTGTP